ncbi:sugar transferase [Pengzhenrongella sicca]|uniref:Sugar transferase n=1 Tax=Pengzhenrongella sicca TaxID=2819238 RepID=A0A8A4ZFE9_9MICO|nr:sugar transferase [Pengzhenrongella sicca]QTE29266.1 sugar transferase [Pengzhenrongella sicca]
MSEQVLLTGSDGRPTPGPHPALTSWLVGFHGTIHALDPDVDGRVSLRSLALAHKSLGTQRLSVLTDLGSVRGTRLAPRAIDGSRHVGASASDSDQPAPDHWDESEPLAAYLDRRLLEARVLYLPNRSRVYHLLKRVLDLVCSIVLLVLASPVILILAVWIRLDSPGPAIFRQQRVTLGGQQFTFYKFRTMWVDAPERFPELYDYRSTGSRGEVFYKLEDDPRNTRVGRWLRRTTLDELPNLVNVLRGDMTLVGPRPELPQLLAHYRPEDLALFFTRAGLTGLAQVAGRSLLTVRERITLDLRYVAQQTLVLDLRILTRTVLVVLLGRGAF